MGTKTTIKASGGVVLMALVLAAALAALLFEAGVNLGLVHLVPGLEPITFGQSFMSLVGLRVLALAVAQGVAARNE